MFVKFKKNSPTILLSRCWLLRVIIVNKKKKTIYPGPPSPYRQTIIITRPLPTATVAAGQENDEKERKPARSRDRAALALGWGTPRPAAATIGRRVSDGRWRRGRRGSRAPARHLTAAPVPGVARVRVTGRRGARA